MWEISSGVTQAGAPEGTRTMTGSAPVVRLFVESSHQATNSLQIMRFRNVRRHILDAKCDMPAFLKHTGTTCPVYTFNSFDARASFPHAVAWDVASDVTSPARALNLAGALIPGEQGGSNRYFTDAARQVVAGVIESFIRHSPGVWTFSDLVFSLLSMERTKEILLRDTDGEDVVANFFGDERTGYQVFTTIVSRMAYFKSVAALWQRTSDKLSIKSWLADEAILLLGVIVLRSIARFRWFIHRFFNGIVFRLAVWADSQMCLPIEDTSPVVRVGFSGANCEFPTLNWSHVGPVLGNLAHSIKVIPITMQASEPDLSCVCRRSGIRMVRSGTWFEVISQLIRRCCHDVTSFRS